MSVKCLCWKCGREIQDTEEIFEINEELWCEDCASPAVGEPDNDYDEESLLRLSRPLSRLPLEMRQVQRMESRMGQDQRKRAYQKRPTLF